MDTSIGKFLRRLRFNHQQILKDMADAIGVSSAFLSAVENGKKSLPESRIKELVNVYKLTSEEEEELKKAAIDSQKSVSINLQGASALNKELAVSFARQFGDIDEETSKKMFSLLNRERRRNRDNE